MSKSRCQFRIGTSGWYYQHWLKRFYPADLPKTRWFEHYAQHFDTVEINNTFYHLPKLQTIQNWHRRAPDNFLYAVKANRYITHIKKLKDTADELQRFFDAIDLLKENLGPILYQLPPSLHKDLELLQSFLRMLPKHLPAVFEFRHKSWYDTDTAQLLEKHNAAFCIHDMPGKKSPRTVTSDIIYVRFHGSTGRYSGSYSDAELAEWADWLKAHSPHTRTIYAYFNNDVGGHAIHNATQLKNLLLS